MNQRILREMQKHFDKVAYWAFWQKYVQRAVFAVWQEQGCPSDTFDVGVFDMKFMVEMEKHLDDAGMIIFAGKYHKGFQQKSWNLQNGMFDIVSDSVKFFAKYCPTLRTTNEDGILKTRLACPFYLQKAFLPAGTYALIPNALENLKITETEHEPFYLKKPDAAFLGEYTGNRLFYAYFCMENGTVSIKYFPYSHDGVMEFLKKRAEMEACTTLYVIESRCGLFYSRCLLWLDVYGKLQGSSSMCQNEISMFPEQLQETLFCQYQGVNGKAISVATLTYIQAILDDNLDKIKTTVQGKTCEDYKSFRGYCGEVYHMQCRNPDGSISLNWHDIAENQIPAAWKVLQRMVAFSEYPLEMWCES